MSKWIDERPKKEGLYWFFGWLKGHTENTSSLKHFIIKITKVNNEKMIYMAVAGGTTSVVLNPKKIIGYWQPINIPEPPSLKDMDILLHNIGTN